MDYGGSTRNKHSGHGAGGASGAEPGSGAYMPGDHRATTIRGSYMRSDGTGVGSGLNALSKFDSEDVSITSYNGARNGLTGNGPDRPNPMADGAYSVTEKGHKMTLC